MSPPSGDKFSVPPTGDLRYDTLVNGMMNETGTIRWINDGQHYEMVVSIPLPFVRLYVYSSKGHIDAFSIAPEQYSEQRGRRAADVAIFNRGRSRCLHEDAAEPAARGRRAGPLLSVVMQLASLGRGDPDKYKPGVTRQFSVSDNDSNEIWPIETVGDESVQTRGGFTTARHFTRLPRREGDRRKLDIWLGPSLGWVPVRILQTERNANRTPVGGQTPIACRIAARRRRWHARCLRRIIRARPADASPLGKANGRSDGKSSLPARSFGQQHIGDSIANRTLYGADMQLTINRIDTRYVLDNEGGGPWLTFIHQLAGDHSVWDQMAGYFRHHYTVLRYDLRGHGDTSVSPDSFTIDDLADDLAELLDKLGAPSTHVVGLSIGGMVAQTFAANHADKVDSLTSVGAPAFIPEYARPTFAQRAASVRENGTASIVDATLERWLTPRFRKAHPEVVELIGETIADTPAEGFARAAEAVSRFDLRDKLPSVSKHTLVIAGEHDSGTAPAASKVIADTVQGAQFQLLDAAHLSPVEQSQRFSALLDDFLRESA